MNYLIPIIAVFLLAISIVDIKYKQVPSIILSGALFIVLALNLANIGFGILAFIFALLLYEADFISGIADIKIITLIGLMATNFMWFFVFIIFILVFGFILKIIVNKTMKKAKETPFIPALFVVYLILWILGGIA